MQWTDLNEIITWKVLFKGQIIIALSQYLKRKPIRASAFQHYQRPHKTEKSLTTALKMYNSNVLSTLLYRAQTWQLKQTEEKMLLTASVCEWFFESDGSNKLPTKRSAWQLTIHLYQTPSGQDDSGFCVFDTPSNSKD